MDEQLLKQKEEALTKATATAAALAVGSVGLILCPFAIPAAAGFVATTTTVTGMTGGGLAAGGLVGAACGALRSSSYVSSNNTTTDSTQGSNRSELENQENDLKRQLIDEYQRSQKLDLEVKEIVQKKENQRRDISNSIGLVAMGAGIVAGVAGGIVFAPVIAPILAVGATGGSIITAPTFTVGFFGGLCWMDQRGCWRYYCRKKG